MFINSIVWVKRGGGVPKKRLPQKNDFILFYGKNYIYNTQYVPYISKTIWSSGISCDGTVKDYDRGRHLDNIWDDITPLRPISRNIFYPTQKPFKLLERVICLSTV